MSLDRLQALLGVDDRELPFLASLPPPAQHQLADDIEAARRAESADLHRQMLEALDHLPWVLRVPIRRLFGLS